MKKTQIIIILFLLTYSGFTQSIDKILNDYMNEIRHGEIRHGSYKTVPTEILLTKDETELFNSLEKYTTDSLTKIRSKAYSLYRQVGQKSNNIDLRHQAIDQLIGGIRDKDTGISGNASEALTGFSKEDFTVQHKEVIGSHLVVETPHLNQLLLLAGYINYPDYKDRLYQITSSKALFKYKWAAWMALARMNEQKAIEYIKEKVQNAPMNDDFVYGFVPDLIYTRQKELYTFLEGIIQSEDKNCLSADPDANVNILCGYRVMEYLAPVIEGYPLPVDEFGDLEVDDYKKALQDVRKWLVQNNGYAIKTNVF